MNPINKVSFTGQTEKLLTITIDVSKHTFNWAVDEGPEGKEEYSTKRVISWLNESKEYAISKGYAGLQIVLESTGFYHKRLLVLARQVGCHTVLVGGAQVKALQVVESNDTGKSDWKDPHTMHLLVKLNKTMVDRQLSGDWLALRELNAFYERVEKGLTQCKNRLHSNIEQLFPDLSFKKDWLFNGETSRRVLLAYRFDPNSLVLAGIEKVTATLKAKGVRTATIQRLFRDATVSVNRVMPTALREVISMEIEQEYAVLERYQINQNAIRKAMIDCVERLRSLGQIKTIPDPALFSPFMLARIFAETGPLKDFSSCRKLLRYAGMNLRTKQSGTVKGKEKQSKKGRCRLRYVLAQATLRLVVKTGLYGNYYHAKKAVGMPGMVAISAVARKLLKLLYGLERSGGVFDKSRVFCCQSQFKSAA